MNKSQVVISCEGLNKSFLDGQAKIDVLKNINLQIGAGEQIAIVGASGSGKSTLLHILGGLDKPNSGNVLVNGQAIHKLAEAERCKLRNQALGFIYQFHHLLPEFTALENVCIPLLLRNMSVKAAKEKATFLLTKVGLEKRLTHRIGEMSGGERQRTAIARALVTQPSCILADEPTGNLDNKTAEKVYAVMLELNREFGTSIVLVTHDLNLAERMDRILTIENGHLQNWENN
jgi:lipoprotein-releasing system ATP-binding protein